MLVPTGLPVVLHNLGDFWAATKTTATVGQKVFASNTDGPISPGAAGAPLAGGTAADGVVASAGAVGALIKITSTQLGTTCPRNTAATSLWPWTPPARWSRPATPASRAT
ncbi:hypothetical protein G6F40_016033 [Rhizopus arrhizus]|nr:hypothetical protein G6F40_016033 [Rhizopus arrhizus]